VAETFGDFFRELDRRDAEREAAKKVSIPGSYGTAHSGRIDSGALPDPSRELLRAIRTGNMNGPWTDASIIPTLEAEARKRKKREAQELVPCPEPIFEPEEL
jgi:hypothetical protein